METTTESKRSDSGSSCELDLTEDVESASELEEVYPEDISYVASDYPRDEAKDYRKYYKQASESEGFDVDSFPGLRVCGGVVPIMLIDDCREELSGFCKQALHAFNMKENADYEFVELIKAKRSDGLWYYVLPYLRSKDSF